MLLQNPFKSSIKLFLLSKALKLLTLIRPLFNLKSNFPLGWVVANHSWVAKGAFLWRFNRQVLEFLAARLMFAERWLGRHHSWEPGRCFYRHPRGFGYVSLFLFRSILTINYSHFDVLDIPQLLPCWCLSAKSIITKGRRARRSFQSRKFSPRKFNRSITSSIRKKSSRIRCCWAPEVSFQSTKLNRGYPQSLSIPGTSS